MTRAELSNLFGRAVQAATLDRLDLSTIQITAADEVSQADPLWFHQRLRAYAARPPAATARTSTTRIDLEPSSGGLLVNRLGDDAPILGGLIVAVELVEYVGQRSQRQSESIRIEVLRLLRQLREDPCGFVDRI
jgi:hypothetical protein